MLALLVGGSTLPAQDAKYEEFLLKSEAQAVKLKAFLPGAPAGLVESVPWSAGERGPRSGYGCGETGCPGLYFPIYARTTWDFEDAALARKIQDAEKRGDALLERIGENREANTQAADKLEAALAQLAEKFQPELESMIAKLSDPKLSEKDRQQLMTRFEAAQKKNEQDQKALYAAAGVLGGADEATKIGKELQDLKQLGRTLELTIDGNATNEWCSGTFSGPVANGTLKGRTLYRYTGTGDYAATQICLAVYLGPAGFKNPPVPKDNNLRTDLKTALVKVILLSSPQSLKADEAIGRQLLEKIDFDGIAKLLQP